MVRKIAGGVAGIVVAVTTVMIFEWISHQVFPPPADLDVTDSAALAERLANAPVAALLLVLAGYVFATFDGTLVATLIGRARPSAYALIIGLLMMVATITNLILIPHPLWFNISAIAGIALAAWLATLCVPGRWVTQGEAR